MHKPPSPVLILGARSDIARALAHRYAGMGCALILGARDHARLAADRDDLVLRHRVDVETVEFDVLAPDPDAFFRSLGVVPGTVVMVAGYMGEQDRSAAEDAEARLVIDSNYTGPARFLLAAARAMKGRGDGGGGAIIGISSVAGDRGRQSNYVYGSAKAGFTAFLSGLRNSLARQGIHVMTVKPGFVATAMTEGLKLPPAITAQPEEVARDIIAAQGRARDVIYTKWMWRPIMAAVRAVPERVFKRMSM